jgi:hypothetical protein
VSIAPIVNFHRQIANFEVHESLQPAANFPAAIKVPSQDLSSLPTARGQIQAALLK